MSDEKPLSETLETIAERIAALTTSVDARFAQVDTRFAALTTSVDVRFAQADVRFSEVQAQLGMKIEAVHDDVKRLYDVVIALNAHNERHDADHAKLERRLDDHDLRLLALEQKNRG